MSPRAILMTGATGKQGGSVLRSLIEHSSFSPSAYTIYALTRSPTSASALRLASSSPAVKLIQGDLNNVPAIFKSLPQKPWGVFSVQLPGKGEVAQGTALVDEAVKAGSEHVVFTSVDRGGPSSDNNPTDVPHFKTKYEIEKHLIRASEASNGKLSYTILRPVFFLDNLEWGFIGKIISTAWRDHVGRPLQVISTTDIGFFGAAAFLTPSAPEYHNAAISLAGDELTFEQANKLYEEKFGTPLPTTYSWIASLLLRLSKDMRLMFEFFREAGFGADVQRLRSMNAGMEDFRAWMAKSKAKSDGK